MKRLIYFDNGATSFPKPKNVINAVNDSLFRCGNPGRSSHELSLYSAKAVFNCREAICSFFDFNYPENVIFTHNTTYALNLAIKGLYKKNSEILISNLEHNSVLRPVHALSTDATTGVSYKIFDALCDDTATIQSINSLITSKTSMVVTTACSNVTGKILPIKEISALCKQKGLKLIIDFAQLAGIDKINLSQLYFDAACFAGHKSLYGIMGTGFCIFGKDVCPDVFLSGGNGVNSLSPIQDGLLPERLESGTNGVHGIIALEAGLKYLTMTGQDYIKQKCNYLENYLTQELSLIDGIRIIGKTQNKVPTVLFLKEAESSEKTSSFLSESGICTRGGFHCSALAHSALGTTMTGGVRVSLSHMNTKDEIDIFLAALKSTV